MKGWLKITVLLLLVAALTGCMPSQQELQMEHDMATMKRRLAKVEQALAAQQQEQTGSVKDRLDALARSQANLQAAQDTLRVNMQSVDGRFADMAQGQAQIKSDLSLMHDDLSLKIKALEDRVTKLETQKPATAPGQTAGAAAASPSAPAAETPKQLYQRGLDLILKKKDFARGQQVLKKFLKRYPKDDLAVNAKYWIGEALYGQKKYEEAILQFQDVIQKYGHHPKVAAALLKQGLAFHALGDMKNARLILQKVIDSFPKSAEAKKAKAHLKEWSKGKKS